MCNVHVAVALATKDNAILWNNMQCAMSTWLEPLVVQIEQKIIWKNMQCAMCHGWSPVPHPMGALLHKICPKEAKPPGL